MRQIPKPITFLTIVFVMIASLYIIVISSINPKTKELKTLSAVPSSTPEVAISESGLPGVVSFDTQITPDIEQNPINRTLQIDGKKYLQQQVKVEEVISESQKYQISNIKGESKTVVLTDKTLKASALYGFDISGQRVALQYDTAIGDKFTRILKGTPVLITFNQDQEQNNQIELTEFVILNEIP